MGGVVIIRFNKEQYIYIYIHICNDRREDAYSEFDETNAHAMNSNRLRSLKKNILESPFFVISSMFHFFTKMESLFTMYMCQWVSLDVIIQFVQVHIFVKAIRENINYNVRLISVILYT